MLRTRLQIVKKLLLTIILTTAAAAFAGTVGGFKGGDAADFGKRFRDPTAVVCDGNYYARSGYYVDASPAPGPCGRIYPSKEATEAAEGHHTAQVIDWKVGPPGPKQTEDWGKPATKPVNLVGRLLGVFGHLFGK